MKKNLLFFSAFVPEAGQTKKSLTPLLKMKKALPFFSAFVPEAGQTKKSLTPLLKMKKALPFRRAFVPEAEVNSLILFNVNLKNKPL